MARINLIPEYIMTRQQRRRHLQRWLAPMAVALMCVLMMLWLTFSQRVEASDVQSQTDQFLAQVKTFQQKLKEAKAKSVQLRDQMERADSLRGKRAWTKIIAVVTQCLPKSAWLTSISTDPTSPSKVRRTQSASIQAGNAIKCDEVVTIDAARKLRLLGYTAGAGEPHDLVRRLKTSGIFKSVTLTHSRRQDVLDGSYFRFEVICAW